MDIQYVLKNIDTIADGVLARTFDEKRDLPIDLDAVLDELEIVRFYAPELFLFNKVITSLCYQRNGQCEIIVKPELDALEERLAIARTLGHFIALKLVGVENLNWKTKGFTMNKRSLRKSIWIEIDPLEQEANVFAAYLLMPQKAFDKYIGLYKKRICTLEQIAKIFVVSDELLRYRMSLDRKIAKLKNEKRNWFILKLIKLWRKR
jgi:Zn-dependent peptidase ImmA (M78 family)